MLLLTLIEWLGRNGSFNSIHARWGLGMRQYLPTSLVTRLLILMHRTGNCTHVLASFPDSPDKAWEQGYLCTCSEMQPLFWGEGTFCTGTFCFSAMFSGKSRLKSSIPSWILDCFTDYSLHATTQEISRTLLKQLHSIFNITKLVSGIINFLLF